MQVQIKGLIVLVIVLVGSLIRILIGQNLAPKKYLQTVFEVDGNLTDDGCQERFGEISGVNEVCEAVKYNVSSDKTMCNCYAWL
jgi:hypothetical protein